MACTYDLAVVLAGLVALFRCFRRGILTDRLEAESDVLVAEQLIVTIVGERDAFAKASLIARSIRIIGAVPDLAFTLIIVILTAVVKAVDRINAFRECEVGIGRAPCADGVTFCEEVLNHGARTVGIPVGHDTVESRRRELTHELELVDSLHTNAHRFQSRSSIIDLGVIDAFAADKE